MYLNVFETHCQRMIRMVEMMRICECVNVQTNFEAQRSYDFDMRDMSACIWKGFENARKWGSMELMKCAPGCSKLRQAAASGSNLQQAAASCGKLRQGAARCSKLRQAAASCSKLQQAAASCSKLQQVPASCNKLQDIHRLHSLCFEWIASIWDGSFENSLKKILRAPALGPSRVPVGGLGSLQFHASAAGPHASVGDRFRIVWHYLQ